MNEEAKPPDADTSTRPLAVRIAVWLLEFVGGIAGLVTFFGFVIDSAFRELLGVEKTSYFSALHLAQLVGTMLYESTTAVLSALLAHWAVSVTILIIALLSSWLSVRIIAAPNTLKIRKWVFPVLFSVTASATFADIVFRDAPFMFFTNIVGTRVRADRQFPEARFLAGRTQRLWQDFVCAHKPAATNLPACKEPATTYRTQLRDDFALNIGLALALTTTAICLAAAHHKFRPPAPWIAYGLLAIGLLLNITGLFYEYGKAFQSFDYDRIQMQVGKEYPVGLALAEDEKRLILYDETTGLVTEVPLTSRRTLGHADLIAAQIAFSNGPRQRAIPVAPQEYPTATIAPTATAVSTAPVSPMGPPTATIPQQAAAAIATTTRAPAASPATTNQKEKHP